MFPLLGVALILNLNDTTWFKGEDGVEKACWIIGAVTTVVTALIFLVIAIIGAFVALRD